MAFPAGRIVIRALAGLILALCAAAAQAASLEEMLRDARGGEVIELPPGEYAPVNLSGPRFSTLVTVRSADPKNPATLLGLRLDGAENLRFENLVFDFQGSRSKGGGKSFFVRNCQNIAFVDSEFDGWRQAARKEKGDDALYPVGDGLYARSCRGVELSGSNLHGFARGAIFQESQEIVVRANDIHNMRSEGLNLMEVRDVLIEGNRFHDFDTTRAFGDHQDMIQFWTASTKNPSVGITIRDNFLDSAGGGWTQSIFMRNERADGGGDESTFYRDITIEDNLIRNGHKHGITVGETLGLTIRNNTLLHNAAASWGAPSINLVKRSRDVTVTGNLAHGLPGDRDGWRVENNLRLQRTTPGRRGWYGDIFVNALTDGPTSLASLQMLPQSEPAQRGLGAAMTQREAPEEFTAVVRALQDPASKFAFAFDAGRSAQNGHRLAPGDATLLWDFGDGATGEGIAVSHEYAAPGDYEVRLKATTPDGESDEATARVSVAEPLLLDLVPEGGGLEDRSPYGTKLPGKNIPTAEGPDGRPAILFRDHKATFRIERGESPQVHNLDRFAIAMEITAEEPGEVFRIHHAFQGSITPEGEFEFRLSVDGSSNPKLTTRGAHLLDGRWRKIAVLYDGFQGSVAIFVDGQPSIRAQAQGYTPKETSWNLNFGSIWGGKEPGFVGRLASFRIYNAALAAALD